MIGGHGLDVSLNELTFLSNVSNQTLMTIEDCAHDITGDTGSYLFHEGEKAACFYLIRKGEVVIEVQVPGRTAFIVETLREDDVLGVSWLMPKQRWSFSARITQNLDAVAVDADKMLAKMEDDPIFAMEIYRQFIPVMGERLSASRRRMIAMFAHPKNGGFTL